MNAARFIAVAAVLASAALPTASHADTLGLHTYSWHDKPGYHSGTPGIYYRTDSGLTLGAMQNSEGHAGAYAGWTWSTDESRFISAAVTAGVIHGYDLAPVLPMVVPSVALRLTDRVSARVLLLPRFHPKQDANAASLTLEVRL